MVRKTHLHNFRLINLEWVTQPIAVPSSGSANIGRCQHGLHLLLFTAATFWRCRSRDNIIDDVLFHVVAFATGGAANAAGRRIQDAELEETIAHATPSPVDVEIVTILKPVADERVAATATSRAVIDHRASSSQFVIDKVIP